MMTFEFGTMPKITVPDGSFLIPKARLEINHLSAKHQETKNLVPLTLKKKENHVGAPIPRPR